MLKLGAHNSIAGGLHNAVAEAQSIGADGMQIFCKNQRQWTAKPLEPEEIKAWKDALAASKLGPVMVHDSYLINMGNPDKGKRSAARAAFLDELRRTEQLGIPYLNFHPGSHMHPDAKKRDDPIVRTAALDLIAECMRQCIADTKGAKVKLVIENAAGQGTNVGSSWEEVGYLVDKAEGKDRVAVTVDTQHAWGAGYDWAEDYDAVWEQFDDCVGIDNLVAFHLNDSKQPHASRLDRHDTIGEGHMGKEFWHTLVNDRRFDGKLGILETPDGPESWRKEIAWLRGLRE
ncbi:MAG: deoxyribonuclease IV [bacterium]